MTPAHACRALAFEHDRFNEGMSFQAKILPLEHRLEKPSRSGPASPALLIDMKDAAALVVAGVEIGDRLDARVLRGGAKRIEDIPAHARRVDPPFPARSVRLAFPEDEVGAVLRRIGLPTAAVHEFDDFDRAIDFVRRNRARWVVKFSGQGFASTRNYVGEMEGGEDVLAVLRLQRDRWKYAEAPRFIVMEHLSGVEVGTGAFFNGRLNFWT